MAVNKVVYNGTALVDFTADTVTADVLQSGYTAHQADGELITGTAAPASNLNLLDNWYFADPISQRGNSEQTTVAYGAVDRWGLSIGSGAKLQIMNGFIRGTRTNNAQSVQELHQVFEPEYTKLLAGKTVTFSVIRRGTGASMLLLYDLTSNTSILNSGLLFPSNIWVTDSITCKLPSSLGKLSTCMYFDISTNGTGYTDFLAAKLELGSQQTLAHKEGDVWVLNDLPPNKALELAKCQRYFLPVREHSFYAGRTGGNSGLYGLFFIPTPVTMRANPTLIGGANNILVFTATGNTTTVASISGTVKHENGIRVNFNTTTDIGGANRVISASSSSTYYLDANL